LPEFLERDLDLLERDRDVPDRDLLDRDVGPEAAGEGVGPGEAPACEEPEAGWEHEHETDA